MGLPVSIRLNEWTFRGDLWTSLSEVPSQFTLDTLRDLLDEDQAVALQRIAIRQFGISRKRWNALPTEARQQLVELMPHIEVADNSKPVVPEFSHSGNTYVLPQADAANVRCLEFALADAFLRDFHEEPTHHNMMLVVATYARPQLSGWDAEAVALKRNDWREPLASRAEVEARALALTDLDTTMAVAIVSQAVAIKKLVHTLYNEWLFNSSATPDDDGEPDEEEDLRPVNNDPDFGWWAVFMRVAAQGVFGDVTRVHQSFLHDVCVYLVTQAVDAKRAKRSKPLKDHAL